MKGASRSTRGAKHKSAPATRRTEPENDGRERAEEVHVRLLEIALEGARGQARRLDVRQRALFVIAVGGVVLVALRGLAAIALARPTSPLLAVFLGVAVVIFAGGFFWATRLRGRLEHLLRDIQALDHVRESLDDEAAPRVEVGPIEAADGSERPVVVVRNDSMERLLQKGSPATDPRSLWIARGAWGAVAVFALAVTSSIFVERDGSAARRWTFVDPSEPAALGFRVVGERSGAWAVEEHLTATGAHALTNRAGDHGSPPATLIAHGIRAEDLRATTRCKVAGEREGAACGLVFRFQDDANHHLARLDFERRRLVVSVVTNGVERELAAAPARIDPRTWQELIVEVHGDHLRASCNERDVVEASAPPSATPGHVGLWVPATGEAYFDELAIDVLPGASPTLAVIPMLRKSS